MPVIYIYIFISLHVLPYNLSRTAPPQVYGYIKRLHVQAITLGVDRSLAMYDQTLWDLKGLICDNFYFEKV